MGNILKDVVNATGVGYLASKLGNKLGLGGSDIKEDAAAAIAKQLEDQKAAKAGHDAAIAQQAQPAMMRKGGMAKKKMADGGKVPQDIDGASATRSPKKGEKPTYEEPGSGIRVDGKPLNKAKGGMVGSSASRRADGMASRGKTRGKMC